MSLETGQWTPSIQKQTSKESFSARRKFFHKEELTCTKEIVNTWFIIQHNNNLFQEEQIRYNIYKVPFLCVWKEGRY